MMTTYINIACEIYNCSIDDIMGFSRYRNFVNARYLIFALALDYGYNPLHIAPMLNRGRCMTYHFLKMVRALKRSDKNFIVALNKASYMLKTT